jgi:sulfatase maturation enzyme AslB (radical SAM superfamily)
MLTYFANYMRYVNIKTRLPVTTTIYGGEPFVHLPTLTHYIRKIAPFIGSVSIVSNGLNIQKYGKEITEMRALLGQRLLISISYNFSIQGETRQEGTYHKVRDNIRWLSSQGFSVNSPVVFTPATIHKIGEVFDDFLQLRNDCKTNRLTWNYFKDDTPISEIKIDTLEKELIRISPKVKEIIANEGSIFRYSMIGNYRGDRKADCLFAAVRAALSPDGCIYPGYDVCHDNEYTKNLLRFGYVGDSFKKLDQRREELLNLLSVDPPLECGDCSSQCRVIPWRTLKDNISQYNQLPHPERCQIIKFIGKYIPIREV